jgi:hypothetical protein
LRQLQGTADKAMIFRRVPAKDFFLRGYTDSDWATDSHDRKSVSGCCFLLSPVGPAISWASRKQVCVALSSCEAEYVAMSQAAQELVFLRGLLKDLGIESGEAPTLYGDNQGAIALSNNPIGHKRSKHIDIRHHYIRQLVSANTIELKYVRTDGNIADALTKNLPRPSFEKFRNQLLG